MSWKVLITARAFWTHGEAANALLTSAGCEPIHSSTAGPLSERELIPQLANCDAVIASSDIYNGEVFKACPNLKVISRWGVGIDAIDLKAATEAGVVITNTPGAMAEAVADFTFALLLSAARRIPEGDAMMRSGGWDELPGTLVFGKTIGLVGAGMIGQAVARRAAGFGMRILAFDPNINPPKSTGVKSVIQGRQSASTKPLPAAGGVGESANRGRGRSGASTEKSIKGSGVPGIQFVSFDQLLAESDFVSIHAPSLPETQGMFNAARFAQMKRTAFLINAARGALVDEGALLDALNTGKIAGAAIDVYANEPLAPDHPLRSAPRCVLTPHNASMAVETMEHMSVLAAKNLLTLMQGARPKTTCNPEVWESSSLRARV